jgi:hypothetical protein
MTDSLFYGIMAVDKNLFVRRNAWNPGIIGIEIGVK